MKDGIGEGAYDLRKVAIKSLQELKNREPGTIAMDEKRAYLNLLQELNEENSTKSRELLERKRDKKRNTKKQSKCKRPR